MNPIDLDKATVTTNSRHSRFNPSLYNDVDEFQAKYAREVPEMMRAKDAARMRVADILNKFKHHYITVRANNLALSHESAIELVKMIMHDADTINYEDIQ